MIMSCEHCGTLGDHSKFAKRRRRQRQVCDACVEANPTCNRCLAVTAYSDLNLHDGICASCHATLVKEVLLDAIEREHPNYADFVARGLSEALDGRSTAVASDKISEWLSSVRDSGRGGVDLPIFLALKGLKPFIPPDFVAASTTTRTRPVTEGGTPADDDTETECICKGNWRKIVAVHESLIGTQYEDEKGNTYTFFGLVHGDDDYYYGMSSKTGVLLLSCVGSIEGHGFRARPRSGSPSRDGG